MATPTTAPRESFFSRHYFLLRRLHSLSGIVPIGAFLIPHLTTNSSIVWGQAFGEGGVHTFQHEVNFIHSLPALVLLEIFLIWLPLFYHAAFGIYIATTGKSNVQHYGYQDNWRYTLQRLTGYIALVFILYHVATLRWGWTWLPLAGGFDVDRAASTTAVALRGGVESFSWRAVIVGAAYLFGMLAIVFHFANGLWTAAITWGLTITVEAQRRWGYVCAVVGIGLAAAGVSAVVGFALLDVDQARMIEEGMQIRAAIIEGIEP